MTEHEQGLFIQEFIGAGALEGGKRGAGTEQARWLEEHYDGTRHEWWHGHVWESNAAGKPFWTSRLPGEIVTDPARMIPERHVADDVLFPTSHFARRTAKCGGGGGRRSARGCAGVLKLGKFSPIAKFS